VTVLILDSSKRLPKLYKVFVPMSVHTQPFAGANMLYLVKSKYDLATESEQRLIDSAPILSFQEVKLNKESK
jgi:hypothetical protein